MTAMRLKRYPSPSGGFALGKMGVGATLISTAKTARDYVQDGLVAMWDGIENAGWGVHDASARTWKDLVGACDFTNSSNPAWGDDHFILTGANSIYVPFNSVSSLPQVSMFYNSTKGLTITVEVVMEFSNVAPSKVVYGGSLSGQWVNGSIAVPNMSTSNDPISGNAHVVSMSNGAYAAENPFGAGSGTYAMCSIYTNSVSNKIVISSYSEGVAYRLNRTINRDTSSNRANIGFGYAQSSYLRALGKVYCARIYSRALTADEIARNYNIDKERFNLP